MYLYLGYLSVQLYTLVTKLFQTSMSPSILFFSIMVVFIWSVIPFAGYLLAKMLNANGQMDKYILFVFGLCAGLIEISLSYFDVLTKEQNTLGTLFVTILFFIIPFISINKTVRGKNINKHD